MAIKTKDEIMQTVKDILGERTDETSITFLEDISDTFEAMSNGDNTDWKKKYEENDAEWKKKYMARFYTADDDTNGNNAIRAENMTFSDLFK